ncbi:MAG TPA: carboxylesterase family protein [Bryobacteraceae bacterium]|jgi:para-nitrobenzyl esterase|nr:carboxylesterase family protein [Bryobacteraceae bacterium]
MKPLRRLLVQALPVVCLVLSSGDFAQAQQGPIARPSAGALEGRTEGRLKVFKGIPYAQPPVGQARWKAPVPMTPWTGVKKATAFGPACVQPERGGSNFYALDPMPMVSEDCLTLNIWTPANARNAPVFFWIYGGSLSIGAGSDPIYNGASLAAQGIVVITVNYRLGVLGWLAHPELSQESPDGVSGNYGLLDQIAALQWVRQNIKAFGGDPSNVTIAGESAGALSVMYLMAAPPARGLFTKAIAESAYMISTPELKQRSHGAESAEAGGTRVAAALHAPNLAAMRAMDARAITAAAPRAGFAPFGVIDGHVMPHQLVDAFDKGEQAPVPILTGFNSGEIRSLTGLAPRPAANAAAYEAAIRDRYFDLSGEFLRLYPAADTPAAMQESIYATSRDALYGWTAERLVRKQTALGKASFLYLFDHGYPAADSAGLHAFHASELPFVFGTYNGTAPKWPKIPATPEHIKLSDAMVRYWSSFVRTGKPRAANEPDWPAFGKTEGYIAFKDAPMPGEHLMPGMYELNEQVVCRRRASGDIAWNWNAGLAAPKYPGAATPCQ